MVIHSDVLVETFLSGFEKLSSNFDFKIISLNWVKRLENPAEMFLTDYFSSA